MLISTPRSNLIVRFLSVFLLCWTSGFASTDQTGKQKVTVVANDVALEVVFKQIEKQTGLRFMYAVDAVDVKEKVTVAYEKVMLDEVLEGLLGKRKIYWIYREGSIVLQLDLQTLNRRDSTQKGSPVITITGRVVDINGSPIPGVTISIKNDHRGTKTDAEGSFSINAVEMNAILLVTHIGYESKEVVVRGKVLDIRINQITGILDETVIVGYGVTTPRFNTGNVSSIKSNDLEKQPVSDPLLALQGRVPGMSVTQTSGVNGSKINIQIRGQNSINNGTQPLFIVDGIPYNPEVNSSLGFGVLKNDISALNFLNPSDIESIDVLKDADATAIYGSRGANGVILVTTKKGKGGISKINVNISTGFSKVIKKRELLNTSQYLEIRREAFRNDGEDPKIENAPDLLYWDTTRYTDWQKEMIGGTARYTDAQVSISEGTTNIQYMIGGNYHKETTVFPGGFSNQRGGAHFSISGSSQNQRLKTILTGSYIVGNNNLPGIDFVNNIYLPPNTPSPYNENGTLNWANSTWNNPYAQLISVLFNTKTNNWLTNVDCSYKILSGLVIKSNFGFSELRSNTFSGVTIAGINPLLEPSPMAEGRFNNSKNQSWILEPQLNYTRQIGEGGLNVLLGATLLSNRGFQESIIAGGISDDGLIQNLSAASIITGVNDSRSYKYAAIFSRIGYNLRDRYLLNITLRRDGSSRFGDGKRYANFGSIGAGWIFSQESKIRETLSFLSFGKLRASYGLTGNDQIGDYQYIDRYEFQNNTYQLRKGLKSVGLFNSDFAWEITKKAEVGVELGFIQDKVLITGCHYSNRSSNQLLNLPLPSSVGATSVIGNVPAIITNKGWEFSLSSKNVKNKAFEWNSAFNISFNRNEYASYSGEGDPGAVLGRALSVRDLYKMLEVDRNLGNFLFANEEGKPVLASEGAQFGAASIDLAPKFFGGFQNNFRFRKLQIDVFFQFVKQNGINGEYNENILYSPGRIMNQPVGILERWRNKGDVTKFQRLSQNMSLDESYSVWMGSTGAYGDASFIRCKNISLSWQLPDRLLGRNVRSSSARVYCHAQNLFTITNNYRGWDPETQGVNILPPLRTVTIGIQLLL